MKLFFSIVFTILFYHAQAQQATTYILIRHAEKDTTVKGSTTMNADPILSMAGEKRAKKLVKVLKKYKLTEIYSTNFIRTKTTAQPIAKKKKIDVTIYSHKDIKAFADTLAKKQGQIILVVGHNTTTPALANLLLQQDKYKPLGENEYNKIFIVTIVGENKTCNVIEY